jgi:hypothetical protein
MRSVSLVSLVLNTIVCRRLFGAGCVAVSLALHAVTLVAQERIDMTVDSGEPFLTWRELAVAAPEQCPPDASPDHASDVSNLQLAVA